MVRFSIGQLSMLPWVIFHLPVDRPTRPTECRQRNYLWIIIKTRLHFECVLYRNIKGNLVNHNILFVIYSRIFSITKYPVLCTSFSRNAFLHLHYVRGSSFKTTSTCAHWSRDEVGVVKNHNNFIKLYIYLLWKLRSTHNVPF